MAIINLQDIAAKKAASAGGATENKLSITLDETPRQMLLQTCIAGIGGAGGNIVSQLYRSLKCVSSEEKQSFMQNASFVAINTDNQDLAHLQVENTLCIGPNVCRGFGAGADPQVGKEAAEDSHEQIMQIFKNYELVILFAGLGGGTGTGATPEVCKYLAEQDTNGQRLILVVFVYPFAAIRPSRIKANNCIKATAEAIKGKGGIFLISNEKFVGHSKNISNSFSSIFHVIDAELERLMLSFMETIYLPGTVNVDFNDIRTVVKSGPILNLNFSEASETIETVPQIIDQLQQNIFFSPVIFSHAKAALIYFFHKKFGRKDIENILGNENIFQQSTSMNLIVGNNDYYPNKKIFTLVSTEYSDDILTEWVQESDDYSQKKIEAKPIMDADPADGLHGQKHKSPATAVEGHIGKSSLNLNFETPVDNQQMGLFYVTEEFLDSEVPTLTRLKGALRYPRT